MSYSKISELRMWVFLCVAICAVAGSAEVFKTRLSPVAMDASMRAAVAGSGSVSSTLTGSRLVISGSFEGLLSPATTARIHQGTVTGVRGPAIINLNATNASSGAISGSFDLTTEQIESLRKGRLYVQLQSEKAPDGNLWGWLLP